MNKRKAKGLRGLAWKMGESNKYREYQEQTFHHVYTGLDRQGNKTFAEVTDPIKLTEDCVRRSYKEKKNDYKDNHKG